MLDLGQGVGVVKMVIRVFTLNIVARTGKIQRLLSNEHELMTGGTAA
ncbi:hypothetical protein [Candidatus Nitrospira allomarina]|jgi:hypothetical protein|uniref:Uncharacterized protein n=1 Tax=Candidatus Nitrospira allomarina TaxID=3020900 RepID=A0AA96JX54_9BACT|nr:hypothetical protein [Candidatus Nitrospira allomarina]WNM58636.1 hypothetical protein PP769_02390 [Candidatus Nitrospira allomarina]